MPGVALPRPFAPSDERLAVLAAAFLDHPTFCRHSLSIRDKRGIRVPLALTPAQIKLDELIHGLEAQGKPVRIVALKARQVHMSVGCAAEFFHRIPFRTGRRGLCLAHLEFATSQIADYYLQFQAHYTPFGPQDSQIVLPALKSKPNTESIEWANDSKVSFGTAGSVQIGRSFAAHYLHLSEFAFYRDASTLMTGLMQVMPHLPETMALVESTANGVGGPFFDLWQQAVSGESDWRPLFYAWWEHPEYTLPVPGDVREFEQSLTPEERALRQQHGITLEQLAWRRHHIANNCQGSVDKFRQEMPSTPEEAFLTSGRPRFDHISIARQPVVRDPLNGDLDVVRVGVESRIQFLARSDGRGPLRIWRRPVPGHLYVIGADPAQGIDSVKETGVSDPDYSCACVLDADTGEQVAVLRERLAPSAFGAYLCALGRWYNDAYLVPEANPIGIALIEEILRQSYPLERIYKRRRDASDRRPVRLEEIGFLTTSTSKPILVSTLDTALRELSVIVRDPLTIQECRTYVWDARGHTNAQAGCHDDLVIALALAITGLMTMPRVTMTPKAAFASAGGAYGISRRKDDD